MILLVAMHYHIVSPEILSSEVGKKISYVDVTEEDARKGMKQMGAATGSLMLC